jgi:hypothetical protein
VSSSARSVLAVAERGAGELVIERGAGLECQRVHRAVAERGSRVSSWRVKLC